MPPLFTKPNEVIRAAFQQSPGALPENLPPAVLAKASQIRDYDDLVNALKTEAKMPEDVAESAASVTVLAALEKFGIDPKEWKFTVSPGEMTAKFYGPEQWENARRFNATWTDVAQIGLLASSVFGLITAVAGVTIASATLASAGAALRSGLGWSVIGDIVKLGALKGIKWLSIPAGFSWLGEKVASFANTQLSTTGDLEGYLLQGATKAAGGSGSSSSGFVPVSNTRSRTQTTSKPKLFTGTFFSGRLDKRKEFERKVDDAITSLADMIDDIETNLVRYAKVFPGFLNYDLAVVNNPKDEYGAPKQGTWVVMNLYLTNSIHKRLLIENILLGPVDPAVYYPEWQSLQSVQIDIPKILTPTELKSLELPTGHEFTIDPQGNVVVGFFKGYSDSPAGAGATAKPPASVPETGGAAVPPEAPEVPLGPEIQWEFSLIGVGGTLDVMARSKEEAITKAQKKAGQFGVAFDINSGRSTSGSSPAPAPAPTQSAPVSPVPPLSLSFPRTIRVTIPALMVRSSPRVSAPLAGSQRLVLGEEFQAIGIAEGDEVEGNNRWWLSSKGNYVWSGGTSQ